MTTTSEYVFLEDGGMELVTRCLFSKEEMENFANHGISTIINIEAKHATAPIELPQEVKASVAKVLRNTSDFVISRVCNAVMHHYQGKATNLAMILVVADDWGLLRKRNQVLDFVRMCFAIGGIPFTNSHEIKRITETVKKQLNGQWRKSAATGLRYRETGMPCDYKMWDGPLLELIPTCDKIAKDLEGPGMFNRFERTRV